MDDFINTHKSNKTNIEKKLVILWLKELVSAIKYLHIGFNILHRDVKPLNIFLKNNHVKLADFGISKTLLSSKNTANVGSSVYWSPEQWNMEPYDFKTDVWALGITFYEMCTNTFPFYNKFEANKRNTPKLPMEFKEYDSLLTGLGNVTLESS